MSKQLPMLEIGILIIHVVGLFAIIVPLLVMAPSRNTGQVALLDFYNGGGWRTVGLATMIGLLTPLGSMLGFDCAVHMGNYLYSAQCVGTKTDVLQRRRSETQVMPFPKQSSGALFSIYYWVI